jgi:hypothetical protein
LILGPQWVVLGNLSSLPGRYLTPGNLFVVFAAALGLYGVSGNPGRRHAVVRSFIIGVLVAAALFNVFRTYQNAAAQARANREFQATLAGIVEVKSEHPELPLLYCSTRALDIEPMISVARFLAVKLPSSERPFLNSFSWAAAATSPLEQALATILSKQSAEGDELFAAIADFRGTNGRCIAVVFSGPDACRCDYSIRVP